MHSLEDYALFGQLFKKLSFKKLTLSPSSDDLWGIFKKYPKLVVAINHGPMMSPGYVNTALTDIFMKNGGAERSYIAIIWKHFYKVPGFRQMAQLITQVEEPGDFDDFLDLYKSKEVNDFYVMPEGENCSFGNGVDIEPFLSPRFLEVAIRAETPVLLAVHHGTHILANPVSLSDRVVKLFKWGPEKTYERVQEARTLSLPKWQGRLPELQYCFKLYHPSLSVSDLAEDKDERKEQIEREGERVRGLMQDMVEVLKAEKFGGGKSSGEVIDVNAKKHSGKRFKVA